MYGIRASQLYAIYAMILVISRPPVLARTSVNYVSSLGILPVIARIRGGKTPEALLTGSGVTEIDDAVASASAVDVMEGGGVDLVVTVEIGVADPSVSVSEESVETVAEPIDSDVGGFLEVENDGDDPAAGAFHDASDHEDPS